MPELPEVEALTRSLAAHLSGAIVTAVSMRSVAALKTFDPSPQALVGRRVTGSTRRGKFVVLECAPLDLVVHLARAGWMRLRDEPRELRGSLRGPLVMVVAFEDGRALEVTEQGTEKRLAVYVVRSLDDVPGIARLGPDALDPGLTPSLFAERLRAEHGTLKSVLADQGVVAGIGNAYSDEILHAARLSPFRKASSLDDGEIEALLATTRRILTDAVRDAAQADPTTMKPAKRLRMRVHGRTGEPCPVCGDVVRQVAFSTRSFQYCATCQTGGRVYADRRLSRLLR
jgi:formamidopyrimidine-DNA glycosylase